MQVLAGTILPLTWVKLVGTMKGGVPGGPPQDTPGILLLGAILDTSEGLVAVKLAGPQPVVRREEPVFLELVKTAATRSP